MKNIQKISKFLLSTFAILMPVLSVSASYDKTKDISTKPEAGLHARNRPEARLRKERNDIATLTEGREQLAANLRDLGEERFEIEKERVAKLALLSEEKISQNPEVPEFKSELFKKGKLIYSRLNVFCSLQSETLITLKQPRFRQEVLARMTKTNEINNITYSTFYP